MFILNVYKIGTDNNISAPRRVFLFICMQALNCREGIYAFRKVGSRRTVEDAGPYIVTESRYKFTYTYILRELLILIDL